MNNIPYTYTRGYASLNQRFPERKTNVLFRKFGENVEVQVVKTHPVPEFSQSFNSHMKKMKNLAKGLVEVVIETKIRTTNEYGYEEPEAEFVITGWTHALSDAHRAALAQAPAFK